MATGMERIWKDCWRDGQPPGHNMLRIFITVTAVLGAIWWVIAPMLLLFLFMVWLIQQLFHFHSRFEVVLGPIALALWLLFLRWIFSEDWWLRLYRPAMDQPSLSKAVQLALFAITGYIVFQIAKLARP